MRKLVVICVAILALTWVLTARSGRAVANPVPAGIEVPDVSGNPVRELGASLSVAEPKTYRNLRIFPLLAENQGGKSFLPIDRAIRNGDLEVQEKGSGEVNTVRVRNNSGSLVFGLSGDMIVGARQDRMLKEDVLIPAHSGWLELEVYCTEHGRWTASTGNFGSIGKVVPGQCGHGPTRPRARAKSGPGWPRPRARSARLPAALRYAACTTTRRFRRRPKIMSAN